MMNKLVFIVSICLLLSIQSTAAYSLLAPTDPSYGYEQMKVPVRLFGSSAADLIKGKKILVMFHSSWCPACLELYPRFIDMGKEHRKTILTAQLECNESNENRDFCLKFGLKSYPKLFYFNNDRYIIYTGDRSKDDILDFVNNRAVNLWDSKSLPAYWVRE